VTAEPVVEQAADPDGLRGFIAELEADGFEQIRPDAWQGPIRRSLVDGGHTAAERMTLYIRPSWPYLPPLIHVPGIASWHADQEALCIWQADDHSQRWTTLQGLYDRIDEWAAAAEHGFVGIENARNPEIYWQDATATVAGLVDIDTLIANRPNDGEHGEFHFIDAQSADGRHSPVVVYDLRPGAFTAMTGTPEGLTHHRQVRGRWFYRTSVPRPPSTLEELRTFLTDTQRRRLDRDLRDRPVVMFGLFWRNEAGLVATVLLSHLTDEQHRPYALVVLRPRGRDALLLRAGPDAAALQRTRVAVIGLGAIGSHVAEQLARAGIGRLGVIDADRLWPANLVRHAAPPGTPAATPKTTAMRDHLDQYPWVEIDTPDIGGGYAWTIDDLRTILGSADLTIDATGHAGLAELTAQVAATERRPFISVALFRGGSVARIRRQAQDDDTPLRQRRHVANYPEIPPLAEEAEYVGTETGCLAQVHNAPPVAVAIAAALAAETAIDHLTGRHDQPDEIIEVIRHGDPPFDQPGRLRSDDLPVTVDLSETARTTLRDAARAALPNEIGGVLLGCIIDGRPTIDRIVEIPNPDATPTAFRIPADATTAAVAQARDDDARLGYLGDWHSHPSGSPPSPRDLASMLATAPDSGVARPTLIIVHPTEEGDDIHAYTATPVGLRAAHICTAGDLPAVDHPHDE